MKFLSSFLLVLTLVSCLQEKTTEQTTRAGDASIDSLLRMGKAAVQRFQRKTDVRKTYRITRREEEILALLTKGIIYKEVADKLEISVSTMKKHIYNIYEKMHVHSKVEAVNKYLR